MVNWFVATDLECNLIHYFFNVREDVNSWIRVNPTNNDDSTVLFLKINLFCILYSVFNGTLIFSIVNR